MQKIFNAALVILFSAGVLLSCKKDDTQFDLQPGKFESNTLTASTNDLVLERASADDSVIRFNGPAAKFGENPVVTYTLQLTLPGDTSTWANAKNFKAGTAVPQFALQSKELNTLLNTMGLNTGVPNPIAFRIKADVNQYNGAASTIPSVYSTVVLVNVTSYGLDLYIPGEYQGWNPGTAPVLSQAAGRPGMYEGYINITGGGTQYFKYTSDRDWNHTNYGDGGNGTFSIDGNAGGLHVEGPGYYEVTADLNQNKWTATKTVWAIIGDATPGGWDNETQMTYDAATEVWKLNANMRTNGSFKFRANNAWAIDFGVDGAGKLVYADNPFFGYTGGLNNLTVPEDGNYDITLDLHISGSYTYILHKN